MPRLLPGNLWRNPWRNRRGHAAMEFALIAPSILLLMLSASDFGLAMIKSQHLKSAARSGATYAFQHPQDSAGITAAVRANLAGVTNATIATPSMSCKCDDGTTANCTTGLCLGGTVAPIAYVSVVVTQPFSFVSPLTASLFPHLATLRADVEVRLH